MNRPMFLWLAGYFVAGMWLTNTLYNFIYGVKLGVTPLGTAISYIAIAYVIIALIFNVIDRRRK